MRIRPLHIAFLLAIMGQVSCSIQKYLPEGTQLYKGATYDITKDKESKASVKSVKKQLRAITAPAPNKSTLGFPLRVWIWYLVGEPESEKSFRWFLRNRIGQEPVLNTQVNVKANAANFENFLENKGYFRSKASGDTMIKGYRMTARYKVQLGMPYKINTSSWIIDSTSEIGKDLAMVPDKENYVKKGEQFDLENIKAERSRVDLALKNRGYYYFSPEHVKAWVDSSNHDHTVNVFFKLNPDIPVAAVIRQRINNIILFPNYTLLYPPPDTTRQGMRVFDSIYIRDTVNQINAQTLTRAVTYRPGSLYSLRAQNTTLNRFINTGVFKFVKNRYETSGDTILPRLLDVYYYLTQLPRKNIQAELGAFTKSNSFTGAQASVSWRNRNAFKGGEQILAKVYGSFESSTLDSLRKHNNFRLGGELSLMFPRFVTPFQIKERLYAPPKTRFLLGYELLRRQALYTKNYFRLQYDFTWKESVSKEHTLAPLSITYNTTTAFSPEYKVLIDQVPALKISNLPEVIYGTFYNFTYHTPNAARTSDIIYFNGNFDAAGNLIGLINKSSAPYTGKFLNAYYSQFVKLDADFRYTRKLGKDLFLANRILVGAGFPYGNTTFLPFSRQFIIGGTNSLRGFQVRQLGPGRVRASALQQLYYPQIGGDYKLELNTELRFPLVAKLKGAVFVDAGNVWTKEALLYGKDAQLTSKFLNDLAVDAGIGFRLDITFLLIRFDLGIPLRVPYLERGKEWIIKDLHPFSNIIYNIAIGYPF
jgi:outer membrane protein assembly factor BamA